MPLCLAIKYDTQSEWNASVHTLKFKGWCKNNNNTDASHLSAVPHTFICELMWFWVCDIFLLNSSTYEVRPIVQTEIYKYTKYRWIKYNVRFFQLIRNIHSTDPNWFVAVVLFMNYVSFTCSAIGFSGFYNPRNGLQSK